MSEFVPRKTPYWDWTDSRIREEIARLECVPPGVLRSMPQAQKYQRTRQLAGLKKELEEREGQSVPA